MATVNLGAIKFNWKGAYNNSTAYVVDDVVSSGGSSYVCILASTGNAVSNGTYWNIMSSAGTNGTDVGTTLTTQGDILYRDGSGLQRLAKGTANQELRINSGATAPEWYTPSAGGITEADQWRPTAATSGANTLITSWERSDTAGATYLGTGMTQSSGIFTFPSTGIYWMQFKATADNNSSSLYNGVAIYTTQNNSTYAQAAISYMSFHAQNSYGNASLSFIFNVNNTSNCKVKFQTAGSETGVYRILGGTSTNESEATFIRIGDA